MNLHNVVASSSAGITLHSIRTRAEEEARLLGVQIGDSEIVGLVPESALRAGGDPSALKIRGGWQRASIESRFAR
jgi:glutamate formiminotransferase